jgi:hypothetical protein
LSHETGRRYSTELRGFDPYGNVSLSGHERPVRGV